jgi:YHS domain-containing protein
MRVDRSKAVPFEHDGHTYLFCSEHCRSQFEADPDAYLTGGPATAHEHEIGHAHAH